MRELRVEEAIAVTDAFDGTRLTHELTKRSIASVRGEAWTPENRDALWSNLTAKERDLSFSGYRRVHMATDTERKGFLDSERVEVTE